jgi:flagellar export protein FliJ
MADDPLDVLLRLRTLAVDQTRQALAACIHAETEAASRCNMIDATIAREIAAATSLGSDDRAVEDFAAWLRRMLPEQALANDALAQAETHTKEARLVLAAGRKGVRAVETLQEKQAVERSARRARQEQLALDEAARRGRT